MHNAFVMLNKLSPIPFEPMKLIVSQLLSCLTIYAFPDNLFENLKIQYFKLDFENFFFKIEVWVIYHFQKPYKCEVLGCTKRYTDPSSLRKHVKSHSAEEQEQYRRTKDLANLAKRSTSPTARYSSWTPGPATSSSLNHHQGPSVILEEQHLLTSSSTLLQTGGTLMTMEDMSSSSPVAPGVPSPLMQHKSREQSQRSKIFSEIRK